MQRRAAILYFTFFIVIAAGSYGFIATAQSPTVSLENADYELSQGDTFTAGGAEFTVTDITSETTSSHGETTTTVEATLEPADGESMTFRDGQTVTLSGTQYIANIVNGDTLQLSTDFEGYESDERRVEDFNTAINGVWMVAIMSGMTAVILLGMAFMPRRR